MFWLSWPVSLDKSLGNSLGLARIVLTLETKGRQCQITGELEINRKAFMY